MTARTPTQLTPASARHIREMMGWFPDARSCAAWAGPEFRFPYDEATFREDVRLDLPSLALVAGDAMLAFGQYYLRAGRCHLARLVVSPQHRGQGVGRWLVRELCRTGCERLATIDCSLFVMEDNAAALASYRAAGFAPAEYPGQVPLANCLYLTAPLAAILRPEAT